MHNTVKILNSLSWLFLMLTAVLLGFKELREPDIWWMLATGNWILNHGEIMRTDIFSYTFNGVEWLNVKWGFEVLITALSRIGGPEFTPVVQAVANVLMLFFLYRIFNLLINEQAGNNFSAQAVFFVTALLYLFVCNFRMTGRPELVSHTFSIIYIWIFLSYRKKSGNSIWWLVPLQIIWTNFHEAYATGGVIMTVMLGGFWLEHLVLGVKQRKQVLKATYVVALAGFAVIIHPWGLRMLYHPFEIFFQLGANKFTTELLGFRESLYWSREAYIILSLFLILLSVLPVHLFMRRKELSPKNLLHLLEPFGTGYLLLILLFFYLSFTAQRNIPFFMLIAIPAIASIIYLACKRFLTKPVWQPVLVSTLFILCLASYFLVGKGYFYEKFDKAGNRYGLEVNPYFHPKGAAEYLSQANYRGAVFSDYLVSNYLIYELDSFRSYIDLRDLDVFPPEFFKHFTVIITQTDSFEAEDNKYHFSYALLKRTNFGLLHDYFVQSSKWEPVYADAVAVLYQKKSEQQTGLPANIFKHAAKFEQSKIAAFFSKLMFPFEQKKFIVNEDAIALEYYKNNEWLDFAMQKAIELSNHQPNSPEILTASGDVFFEAGSNATAGTRDSLMKKAQDFYYNAIQKEKEHEEAYLGMSKIAMEYGDLDAANYNLNIAVKINENNIGSWVQLSSIASSKADNDPSRREIYLEKQYEYLSKAWKLDRSNDYIRFYLGITACQLRLCDECTETMSELGDYPAIPEEDRIAGKNLAESCRE